MTGAETVTVGRVLPKVKSVSPVPPTSVEVVWARGEREGRREIIDLAPMLLTFKLYRPLREAQEVFRQVNVAAYGSAIAWGDDEAIDLSAVALADLARQQMGAPEFKAWMKRCCLTLDSAAAQLGLGRRVVAYYASGDRAVPRTVSLACAEVERHLRAVS